jgi:signal transduction histidine kinase
LRTCQEDAFVLVEIEDTGPAIADDIRHRIFDPPTTIDYPRPAPRENGRPAEGG